MSELVVGKRIIELELVRKNGNGGKADKANLKNSTYDLTIGEIVPLGRKGFEQRQLQSIKEYHLPPSHMVLVLSAEDFKLPENITGLATLRSTLTQQGLLALNVGIIDPGYSGPISAALMNFSDRSIILREGEKFFRVLFIEHESVAEYAPKLPEARTRQDYLRSLEDSALNLFPPTYLNTPTSDNEYLARNFWKMIRAGLGLGKGWLGWSGFLAIGIFLASLLYYAVFETGYWAFYLSVVSAIKDFLTGSTVQ